MTDIHNIEDNEVEVNKKDIAENLPDLDVDKIQEDFNELDIEELSPNDEEVSRISNLVEELRELTSDYFKRLEEAVENKDMNETSKQAIKGFLIEAFIKTELTTIIMTLVPEINREEIIDEIKESVVNEIPMEEKIGKLKENLSEEERERLEQLEEKNRDKDAP